MRLMLESCGFLFTQFYENDAAEYKLSTIQIVEDFIRTSSFSEFRKSLQLLFAFLGHIKTGVCLQVFSRYNYKGQSKKPQRSGTRRAMVCLILQVLDARRFLSRSSGLVFT
ncbi:hypothetical protein RchiOBHm_Chr3g0467481 [Rosa chinensis]|uniref:Uncharacterized protein n=1 Tax=Rosa chinensis TaxID=74649 RepID=A0A2P6RAA1_ROSCH|nr:hypothetical protein RchiOBHm_Chr3g0467481 [Rosa chinensis]